MKFILYNNTNNIHIIFLDSPTDTICGLFCRNNNSRRISKDELKNFEDYRLCKTCKKYYLKFLNEEKCKCIKEIKEIKSL